MKSEFREIEVIITSDGEEFLDEDNAQEHQEFIYARDAFLEIVGCTEDDALEVVGTMRAYLEHAMKQIDSQCLSI